MERLIDRALQDLDPGSGRPCTCRVSTLVEIGARDPLPDTVTCDVCGRTPAWRAVILVAEDAVVAVDVTDPEAMDLYAGNIVEQNQYKTSTTERRIVADWSKKYH